MLQQSFPSASHVPRVEANGPIVKIFLPDHWNPFHVVEAVDDGPPHDHPFGLMANVLIGGYIETVWVLTPGGGYTVHYGVERKPGTTHQIDADTIHLITGLPKGFSVTYAEPEKAKRQWFHYQPQADGSILRSPNWDGPWEDYHPAGPVYHVDHADLQAQGIARLAPVAAAGMKASQTIGDYIAQNPFVIGPNNSWKEALAAMYNGYAVTQEHWKGHKWVIENNSRQIMLVTGATKEEWAASAELIKEIPDMEVIGRVWIVLPQIHPIPPTI